MSKEIENIELRSEEVQEILGHIPSRLIRYGITIIILVVVVLFMGSFFFKYPDILRAPVEVVSENPPATIVAKTNGNLTIILVVDSQRVVVNERLAVIKNPANIAHVEWLKKYVEEHEADRIDFTDEWLQYLPDTLNLGEIQNSFTSFQKEASDYLQFKELCYYQKKTTSLKQKKKELQEYVRLMQRQASLKKDDYQLAENQFLRDSGLFVKDVISLADFEKSSAVLLQNGLSLENARSVVVTARMQMTDLDQQITDMELEDLRKEQEYLGRLSELFQNLESNIAGWYDTYMLVSPIDGIVAFNKIWSKNQYVKAGDDVFTIVPLKQSKIIGRITLPAKGAGKVRLNQAVNLKFANYPDQEFGMITARVASISMVPAQQKYMVEVDLADSLITNYGYVLPFSQRMVGTAEIITDDLPLIVRLFNPLKAIFKNHWSTKSVQKVKKRD
ncbi:MAG: HlyD family efflux transporter periplasmic adaptor subunit [Salinivirgaceae bacterium]|jgi:multidrug resistance efflux pump|nr:HlyD family efflux transporter periplasmic adaptor subunit [Salinivirgaceae bacterium]